jgi:AcrR family transcriptional regulator
VSQIVYAAAVATRSRASGANLVSAPARGGAPAQERELRAQGRKTMRKLLDAGRIVFEQRGYHAARVDDVVKMAKTSHGTFYLYFSNKEDLFKALAEDAMADMAALAEQVGPIGPGDDGRDAVREWVEQFFDVYTRHSTVIRAWTEGEVVDNDLGRQGQKLLGRLAQSLSRRIAEAEHRTGADPEIAALACLSMLERFTYLVQSRQITFEREAMLDSLAAVMHAGFFGGGAARLRRLGKAR